MRRMALLAVICTLALAGGARAQTPQQGQCTASLTRFIQAMELYIQTLEVVVPGQSPNPQTAALELVRIDALVADWSCAAGTAAQ